MTRRAFYGANAGAEPAAQLNAKEKDSQNEAA